MSIQPHLKNCAAYRPVLSSRLDKINDPHGEVHLGSVVVPLPPHHADRVLLGRGMDGWDVAARRSNVALV